MELADGNPLVSILIPVYNTQDYLKTCIDSVIGQSYKNLHVVLLNDGSTDSSGRICMDYASKDARVRYLATEHSGIAQSRNRLLEAAKGKYTLFVDSDDWLEHNAIEYLVRRIEVANTDVAVFRRYSQGKINREGIMGRHQAVRAYLVDGAITASLFLKLVKTSLYGKLSFDKRVGYGEDVLMTWNILHLAETVLILNAELYHYRNNPLSITNAPFSPTTCSLRFVWDKIVDDCRMYWPQYYDAAKVSQAYGYIWILYTAIRSDEPNSDVLRMLQRQLRTEIKLVPRLKLSFKGKMFAYFAAFCYTFTRIALSPIRKRLTPLR